MPLNICSRCGRLSRKAMHPECKQARQADYNARKPSAYERGYNADYYRNRRILLADPQAKCAMCGVSDGLEADHKIPLSKGGTNDLDNLQALCRFHNRQKGAT